MSRRSNISLVVLYPCMNISLRLFQLCIAVSLQVAKVHQQISLLAFRKELERNIKL